MIRECECDRENPKNRDKLKRKLENLLVVDHKANIPASGNEVGAIVVDQILAGKIDGDEKYLVDKEDFETMTKVVRELRPISRRYGKLPRLITACDAVRECLTTDKESGSCKIVRLDLSLFHKVKVAPAVIGNLTHLQELNLSRTDVVEIPTNIMLGCKDLKILNLSWMEKLSRLPDEIGNLSELRELYLDHSRVLKLPGNLFLGCKQLKILSLNYTFQLKNLPNEIGNLSELRELYLGNSMILPLPNYSTWGKLQRLEVLDLRGKQIQVDGDSEEWLEPGLTSLRKLNLRDSTFLEGTPRDLFLRFFISDRLCDINLSGARDLTSLPDIIGNLTMLERLDLSFTKISSLPPAASGFYDRLVHLKVLNLTSTPVLRQYPQLLRNVKTTSTHRTVHENGPLPLHDTVLGIRCPILGCIGLRPYQTDAFQSMRTLRSVLARNRARSRIASMTMLPRKTTDRRGGGTGFSKALWPVLLERATGLYAPYDKCEDGGCDCRRPTNEVDALFGLLVSFGESILGAGDENVAREEEDPWDDADEAGVDGDGFVLVDELLEGD